MKIVNLTPHDIHIVGNAGNVIRTYPASGEVARVAMKTEHVGQLPDGTPLTRSVADMDNVTGLPEPQDDTMYIVSLFTKSALPSRTDLLVPNEAVRDEAGRIVGVQSLGV